MTDRPSNEERLATLEAKASKCPEDDLYKKYDTIETEISKISGSVDTLRSVIVPLIAIGNLLAIVILISLVWSINSNLNDFQKVYHEHERTWREVRESEIKVSVKYFNLIDQNIKNIDRITIRLDEIQKRINNQTKITDEFQKLMVKYLIPGRCKDIE